MYIGNILWELICLAFIFGALGLFWWRSGRKIEKPAPVGFASAWFSWALVWSPEGLLLSPYGFGCLSWSRVLRSIW